ncbi:hypothetical protein MP638_000638 [Amoeboaphelidium occidentale]|nr:hypothetical protein MP638_000638 [Amoeboaphelidium occidentale]
MKVKRVQKPEDFKATLNELNNEKQLYVVFFGSEDPETKESWCPDCVVSDPVIRRKIASIEGSVLVECPVGLRSEWKGKTDHPYKVNPLLRITNIPTLLRWVNGKPTGKLVEGECLDTEKLQRLCQ